jgi:hypothetical protein
MHNRLLIHHLEWSPLVVAGCNDVRSNKGHAGPVYEPEAPAAAPSLVLTRTSPPTSPPRGTASWGLDLDIQAIERRVLFEPGLLSTK